MLSGEVADWLRERCDAGLFTTRGLAAELAARGVKTDRRVVWVFLHAEAERDRPDIARKRWLWKARQHRIDPQRLVFIDETWSRPIWVRYAVGGRCGRRLAARELHGRSARRLRRCTWVNDGPINEELHPLR